MLNDAPRSVVVPTPFSLPRTAAPAAWVGDRSPRHCWRDGAYIWVGREDGEVVWRRARQISDDTVEITGSAEVGRDQSWLTSILGVDACRPTFEDQVIRTLDELLPGLRPLSDGNLFDGIVTSIIGQSISVAAAAVAQRKLCQAYGPPVVLDERPFWAMPTAAMLAGSTVATIRASGVTWKRADTIHKIARQECDNNLPTTIEAVTDPAAVVTELVKLPGIGRWTAESAVLWGTGAIDAHPTNDVALLRAARTRYRRPYMTLRDLDSLAEGWRPGRSIAARLLWTDLLGSAP